MSTPSPTASDISSFADWERLHPNSLTTNLQRDMSSPSRIWKGEDSSNDARGSGSSSDNDDNLDLPPASKSKSKPLSEAKTGGDVPGKKGKKGALKGRTEIPSSTADESSQSQKKKIKELERIEVCFVVFN